MTKFIAKKYIIMLCTALMCVCFFMEFAGAAYANSYDFSRAGDHEYRTVTAAQLLDDVYGDLSEYEKRYFDENESFAIKYSESINSSYIHTHLDDADGSLRINALPYSYEGINGEQVVWSPENAYIKDEKADGMSEEWTMHVTDEDGDVVEIEYSTDLNVSASDINAFAFNAYNAAKDSAERVNAANAEYDRLYAAYLEDSSKYEQYKKDMERYELDLEAYNKYVSDRKIWEQKNEAYEGYRSEYERYLTEKKAYEDYQKAQNKYLADLEKYNHYLEEYEKYSEKKQKYDAVLNSTEYQTAAYHLKVLDYITKPVTEMERTISSAILGESVTKVLERKNELIEANVIKDEKVFDVAEKAAYELRSLINQYLLQTTDRDKYMYYITSHAKLDENFCDLLRALAYLYDNETVSRLINTKFNRTRQYEILLAQLYYISHALHDGIIPNYIKKYQPLVSNGRGNIDDSYRIGAYNAPKLTPAQVLGNDILEDGEDLKERYKATPLASGYPELPELPKEPTRVERPTPPQKVTEPVPPLSVDPPGEPPLSVTEPTRPDEVTQPTKPVSPVHSQKDMEQKAAFESGEVKAREPLESDHVLELKTRVKKYFRNAQTVTVRFYASKEAYANGDEPLCQIDEAVLNTSIQFEGELPLIERLGYDVAFDHWEDSDGTSVSLSLLQTSKADLDLFPHYAFTPKKCDVIWEVDGNEIHDTCDYDASPFYGDELPPITENRTDGRLWKFVGWERDDVFYNEYPLPIVTGADALESATRYKAVFEHGLLVEWQNEDGSTIEKTSIWGGETPVPPSEPTKPDDDVYRYYFVGWGDELGAVYEDIVYRAQFDKYYLVGAVDSEEQGGSICYEEDAMIVSCIEGVRPNIALAISIACERGLSVEFTMGGYSFELPVFAVLELEENNISSFELYAESGDKFGDYFAYSYALRYIDIDGADVAIKTAVRFTASYESETFDTQNSRLTYTNDDGETVDARIELTQGSLSFSMLPGVEYFIRPYYYYSVTIKGSEYVDITVEKESYESGDPVYVTFSNLSEGMYIRSVYVVDSEGVDVTYEKTENGIEFAMPSSDIILGVTCDYYTYNVVFKSEGMVLLRIEMRYGETIIPPESPTKATDGEYEYTFVGWDKDVGIVTGDVEFNAVFDRHPLEKAPEQDPSSLLLLIRAMRVILPILLVAIVALVVFLVVRRRRKRAVADGASEGSVPNGGSARSNAGIKVKGFFSLIGKKIVWLAKRAWASIVFAAHFVYTKLCSLFGHREKDTFESDIKTESHEENASVNVVADGVSDETECVERISQEEDANVADELAASAPKDAEKTAQKTKSFTIYIRNAFAKVKNAVVSRARKIKEGVHALIVAMSDDVPSAQSVKKVDSTRQTQKTNQSRPNTTRKGNTKNTKKGGGKHIIIVRNVRSPKNDEKNRTSDDK